MAINDPMYSTSSHSAGTVNRLAKRAFGRAEKNREVRRPMDDLESIAAVSPISP